MSVELICPHCGFSKKLSEKRIPVAAKMAICPRCHEKFPLSPRKKPGVMPPALTEIRDFGTDTQFPCRNRGDSLGEKSRSGAMEQHIF